MTDAAHRRYWSATRRLTAALLGLWLAANLGLAWFARDLDAVTILGLPGAYALAALGLLLMYLLIVVVHAVAMDRLEARCLQAALQSQVAGPADTDP